MYRKPSRRIIEVVDSRGEGAIHYRNLEYTRTCTSVDVGEAGTVPLTSGSGMDRDQAIVENSATMSVGNCVYSESGVKQKEAW